MLLIAICLLLYTTAIPVEEQFQEKERFEKIAILVEALKDQRLSEKVIASLRSYEAFLALKNETFLL